MTEKNESSLNMSFVQEVRRTLSHLYDWVELSKSPLLGVFGVAENEDPPAALRNLLRVAIESLKPTESVSPKARVWRTYQILYTRFIEQFTQKEVSGELGLSIRHLRREESQAIQTLAAYLWEHFNLAGKWRSAKTASLVKPQSVSDRLPLPKASTYAQELGWVQNSLPSEAKPVKQTIQAALNLVNPLAQNSSVTIDLRVPANIPQWVIQVTPIQQALLIVFTEAVSMAQGGSVFISAKQKGSTIVVRVKTNQTVSGNKANVSDRLEMALQLVSLSGGTLEYSDAEGMDYVDVKISLPAEDQIPVMVVDDNADTLQLLERYLSNSRYQFIGTSDPHEVIDLAIAQRAQVIVLDVMLPDIDGWEMLGRLHGHPQTSHIPLIICTILPQEQLALNLGATAFLRKPVSRSDFLRVLDHLLALPPKESG